MNEQQSPPTITAALQRTEIDIHAVLAELGAVAVTWCIEDVQSVRPDLTSEQAWEVLARCRDKHDPEWGFTWSYLKDVATILFPASHANREEELL